MSCLLIVLYVTDEFSYDRFHDKGDQIYRLFFTYTSPNGESFNHAIGPYRLALFIAMLTVVFQGWRAANMNPSEALRHD